MGDHVRHQTRNSNEMIRRFLNDISPAPIEPIVPRMYLTSTWGYGDRLPCDHHEEIAAIAPRAVLIDNTDDDYADNAEGDAIGYEGAMPVYEFLGVPQNLALDLYMGGRGHSLKPSQAQNLVNFANMVLFGKPLAADVKTQLTTDPYLKAGTYDTYYGGLRTMMPWADTAPGKTAISFDSSLPDQCVTPGRRLSLEDKPIGPVEAEMPDLLGSDPIRERTALDAMHYFPLPHNDLERSPIAEVGPPGPDCFFSARSIGIVID